MYQWWRERMKKLYCCQSMFDAQHFGFVAENSSSSTPPNRSRISARIRLCESVSACVCGMQYAFALESLSAAHYAWKSNIENLSIIEDNIKSETCVDSSYKGFCMAFLWKTHELSFLSPSLYPCIFVFLTIFFFSFWRFKEPILWVTSFAHFISVNGGGDVTLASLLFNAVHAPFCKLTGVFRLLYTLYTCTCYQHSRSDIVGKDSQTMIFAAFFEDGAVKRRRRQRQRWQITKRWEFFSATGKSMELVLKYRECVSNSYIYGGECICGPNEGR